MAYDVNSLPHVADDAILSGPLDNTGSFIYDSFLGVIDQIMQGPTRPLEQLKRWLSDLRSIDRPRGKRLYWNSTAIVPAFLTFIVVDNLTSVRQFIWVDFSETCYLLSKSALPLLSYSEVKLGYSVI